MNIIKKLARKLLFPKKKKTTLNTKLFTTTPTTTANAVADPVISFDAPKIGGYDIDDKKNAPHSADKSVVKKKSPGRPKGQGNSSPAKKTATNTANKPKAKPKPKTAN